MTAARLSLAFASMLLTLPLAAEPITTVLSLKGKLTMEQLAQNVHKPSSDHYNRFYEPAEIRQLAGPSDSDYQALLQGLKGEGLKIVSESPTHLWVSVRGESKILESLFNTKVEHTNKARHQLSAVHIPFNLSLIQSVTGLDSTRQSRPHIVRTHSAPKYGGGIQPSEIKKSYGFQPLYEAGLSGAGQHIAIATYDGFRVENVQKYYQLQKLNPMPTVDRVDFNGSATYAEGSAAETELDAELSGMIAPGVSVHVFPSATNDDAGELQMFTAILDDNRAKVANYSWGGCEDEVSQEHREAMAPVFARAVAQGVNIFVASGDSGSDSCGNGRAQADWPAANPHIVSVGGTTYDENKGLLAETGWDGSGGGISGVWELPSWQNSLGGIFTKRSYPDVAFNADPYTGQAIYTGPPGQESWIVIGGTSMSAPQWAGFLALVGESRMKMNKADIGFINPIIYGMSPANQASLLHDVTDGNNGEYENKTGWDAVTGFGSMQADALLEYFKNL